MTTINDISDFARIIREQPEWADTIRSLLLGKELLELPARFAEFVELTNRNFQLVYERLERLESDMVEVKADLVEVKTELAELNTRVSRLETDVSSLKTDVSGLKTDVSSLRTDMNLVKGKLDNAVGTNYELKVTKSIGGVIGTSYRRVRVLQGLPSGPSPEFMDLVADAEDDGVITDDQLLQIQQLDLVMTGRRKTDGAEVYIAGEVSITVGENDITRAAQRAAMLSAAVGQPVEPVVIATQIDDARMALAATNNVAVFLVPEDF